MPLDVMTSEALREKIAKRIIRAQRALERYGEEFVFGRDYSCEKRKVIDRSKTLSPHEHRREKQINESRSATVVKVGAVPRDQWPLHRSTVMIYVEYHDTDMRLYASRRRLRYIEEVPWDKLDSAKYTNVLDELEFLLKPILDQLVDEN